MPADSYIPEVAVASIDILGVKNLIEHGDESLAALNTVARFVRNATSSGIYDDPELSTKTGDTFADDVYLGDSVYLFADPRVALPKQISGLVIRVATLIATGLYGEKTFLVRAGIAVGDLRRRHIQNERIDREILIGSAMARAHQLETAQRWIGGAVARGAPVDPEAQGWTHPFAVPTKGGADDVANPVAVNWIGQGWSETRLQQSLRGAIERIGGNGEAAVKLENTLSFVRHVFEQGAFAPMGPPEG